MVKRILALALLMVALLINIAACGGVPYAGPKQMTPCIASCIDKMKQCDKQPVTTSCIPEYTKCLNVCHPCTGAGCVM